MARSWRIARFAAILLLAMGAGQANAATEPPCVSRAFEGSRFTICGFDGRVQKLRLVWDDSRGKALRSFLELKRQLGPGARVRFAMNAGMFDDVGAPVGLFVANGLEVRGLQMGQGSGNFFLKPNGVFLVDKAGVVHVETTEAYAAQSIASRGQSATRAMWATQSGPMLVIDGALNPAFQADGPSRFVRNGVGVDDGAHAIFAISDEPVSFGKFARFFRDGLGCANALYFDGTVSSLWVPAQGRMDSEYSLGPMVVIEDK